MSNSTPSRLDERLRSRLLRTGKLVSLDKPWGDWFEAVLDAYIDDPVAGLAEILAFPYDQRNRLIRAMESPYGYEHGETCLRLLAELPLGDLLTQQYVCRALNRIGASNIEQTLMMLERMAIGAYPKAREFAAKVIGPLRQRFPAEIFNQLIDWSLREEDDLRELVALCYRHGAWDYAEQDIDLLDALSLDEASEVRRNVAIAMRHYLGKQLPTAFRIVQRLANDNRWETASEAIHSMGYAGVYYTRQALRTLRRYLLSQQPTVATTAARSLRRLAREHPRRTFGYYRDVVRERHWMDVDVLHTVLQSIQELMNRDPRQALELVSELAKDDDPRLAERAIALVEYLKQVDISEPQSNSGSSMM